MKRKRIPTEVELDNIFERFGLERRKVMPQEIATMELKPHPRNELIYGQEENVSDLITLIEEAGGILVPLVINDKNIILSGHRRWLAAKKLNFKTVPCEVRTFESPEDELEFLLISNVSRMKTREQKAREGIVLEEVLSAQSAERRRAKLKQFQSVRDDSSLTDETGANSSDETVQGRTRDEVAKALKIGSGKQFDRMKAVIKKADELRNQGKDEDAELFLAVLNRSASAAESLMSVTLESLSPDDREQIRAGKVAPSAFLSGGKTDKSAKPAKEKDAKEKSPYVKSKAEIKAMNRSIKLIEESVEQMGSSGRLSDIRDSLEKVIADIHEVSYLTHHSEYVTFNMKKDYFDLAVTALTESLPSLSFDARNLEICKKSVEEEMEKLKRLLSVIESEMEKTKDDE